MKAYFLNIIGAISRLINAISGGHPDVTLSASCYAAPIGTVRSKLGVFIDGVASKILGQKNHCEVAFRDDVQYAVDLINQENLKRGIPLIRNPLN